jgi:hypothetical protein
MFIAGRTSVPLNIALAAAVGPDDGDQSGFEMELRPVGEALEPRHFQSFEIHVGNLSRPPGGGAPVECSKIIIQAEPGGGVKHAFESGLIVLLDAANRHQYKNDVLVENILPRS